MAAFCVTTVAGIAWSASRPIREQPHWDAHAAHLDALVAAGVVLLGGPLGSADLHAVGAVVARLAVVATDEPAVRDAFDDDPWIRHRIVVLGSIEPWRLWLRSPR